MTVVGCCKRWYSVRKYRNALCVGKVIHFVLLLELEILRCNIWQFNSATLDDLGSIPLVVAGTEGKKDYNTSVIRY